MAINRYVKGSEMSRVKNLRIKVEKDLAGVLYNRGTGNAKQGI